jgi:uncharacterized membrane protein YtjA (UPF0391 family)
MEQSFCRLISEHRQRKFQEAAMGLVVTLLLIGLVAAILGFGGVAGASFAMAKIIFFIILIMLLISIVFGTMGARRFW